MSDGEFWVKQFKTAVFGVVAIVISIIGGCSYTKYAVSSMVENGASPLEAACALEAVGEGSIPSQNCTLFLTR